MSKITSEHLARAAYIYVRQSTAYQVVNNLESQRRQYGLVERARSIRWRDGPARIRENYWPRSAKAGLAQWYRWKPRALRGTGVIGTPCWNSVAWSVR